jgi:hypothetical protein
MGRLIRWLFAGLFKAEYDAGYRAAVDHILLLPEKVRLGNTLELDSPSSITNCSFVGGSPAIFVRGEKGTIQDDPAGKVFQLGP